MRGGSWQWAPFSSSRRNGIGAGNGFIGALEGFRLALNTNGKALPSQEGNKTFVKKLTQAQKKSRLQHKKIPIYPDAPQGLKITKVNRDQITLSWNKNVEAFVSGYRVYRQDPLINTAVVLSKDVTKTYFVDPSPLVHNARYFVTALNGESESLTSDPVDSGLFVTHTLPVKIQGEAFSHAVDADVGNSFWEPEGDKIVASLGDKMAAYQIQVTKAGKFQLDARVFHSGQAQKFELWLNDKKFANPILEGERGWKTIDNIPADLPEGIHTLMIKGEQPDFAVNWLDVKAVL